MIRYRTAIRSALGPAPAANELLLTWPRTGPSVVLASGGPAVVAHELVAESAIRLSYPAHRGMTRSSRITHDCQHEGRCQLAF